MEKTLLDLVHSIKHNKLKIDKNNLSPDCVDVITRLLEKNQEKRISCEELLAHPWFASAKTESMQITTTAQNYDALQHIAE